MRDLRFADRTSGVELQKLTQRLVKPNGEAWEEGGIIGYSTG